MRKHLGNHCASSCLLFYVLLLRLSFVKKFSQIVWKHNRKYLLKPACFLVFLKNPVGCVTTRTQGSIFHVKRCNDIPWPWWRGQSPTKAILSAPMVDKSRTAKGRWKRVAVPCMKSVLMRSCPRTMSCDKKAMGVVNAVPQTRQKNYRWQIAW